MQMPLTPEEKAVLDHLLRKADVADKPQKPPKPAATPQQMTSARLIKGMRESRNLTLREAGELAQISYSTIAKIEKMPTPWDGVTLATIRGLAKAYGVSRSEERRVGTKERTRR